MVNLNFRNRRARGPASSGTPTWSQHLKGWQKVFGLIAFIGVLLIIVNPELFALGILGDTAFFDMLVLALALQMHLVVARALQRCKAAVTRGARRIGIPSPGLCYLLALSALFVSSVASSFQNTMHRLFPSS
jgi:hypothetical protein